MKSNVTECGNCGTQHDVGAACPMCNILHVSSCCPTQIKRASTAVVAETWESTDNDLDQAKYFAKRLAHCWNCHDELLEALKELHGWVSRGVVPSFTKRNPMPVNCKKAMDKASAAIAKASK